MQHSMAEYGGAPVNFEQAWDNGMGPFFRRLARRMYENTQDTLAAEGVTELSLYRGMKNRVGHVGRQWATPGVHEVTDLMPANSWSSSRSTAANFGGSNGVMLVVTVPASRILGSARTGFGCWGEWEFAVLNGPGNVTVYIGGSAAIPKGT